jgi:G3E family GTPase
MIQPWPVPVAILTGFLGSGKTTLLNRLLKDGAFARTAVIINEFGDIGLDHLLVEQSGDGIIELADGCLCCTVRGQLTDTLAELIDRLQTGRSSPIDRIIIETTGLADPVPVMQAVSGHPVVGALLRLAAVVTVVDRVNGEHVVGQHREARAQVAVSDALIVTKTELVDEGAVSDLAWLGTVNPLAPIIDVCDMETISAFMKHPLKAQSDAATVATAVAHTHHHHHDINRHDARIGSISLRHSGPLKTATVVNFLDLLRSTHGADLLRVKGIVETLEARDKPLVVHAVQQLLHPLHWLSEWPDTQRGTRLVVIGRDLPVDHIRRMFAAFVGEVGIDQPDRSALMDNPLALAGR